MKEVERNHTDSSHRLAESCVIREGDFEICGEAASKIKPFDVVHNPAFATLPARAVWCYFNQRCRRRRRSCEPRDPGAE
jgi:hypothetical protein